MRIAIAGAGIAGLTAALALAKRGFSVEVFERTPSLDEVGAGIQLSPNAMKVLEQLGLAEELKPNLTEPRAIEIRDASSGRTLTSIPLGVTARNRYGASYALIHRADLQASLYAAARRDERIEVRLHAELHEARGTDSGVVFRAGGKSIRADVLVAADGLNSKLRTGYFGHPGPRQLGKTAWRATMPVEAVPLGVSRDATNLWLGHGGHLVHYPVLAGTRMNVVVIAADSPAPRPPVSPFGAEMRQLIEAVPTWTPWPLFDNDVTRPWVRGRVVLIGDAAHAMPPTAAQGGAQAIEDASVLATCLAAQPDDPSAALVAYESKRRPRVQRVAHEAHRNLAIYDLGTLAAFARNAALSVLPTKVLLSRLDWLFGWEDGHKIT